MENNNLTNLSAEQILKQYQCSTFEDFADFITYEINEQFGNI